MVFPNRIMVHPASYANSKVATSSSGPMKTPAAIAAFDKATYTTLAPLIAYDAIHNPAVSSEIPRP